MTAIVLAGGMGTRLQTVVSDVAKPMAAIKGKPFLEYLLNYLANNDITDIILSVGYKWETIRDCFGGSFQSIQSITYSFEETPLGTGGAIMLALELCERDNVFVLNGDSFFSVNLRDLMDFHLNNNADITLSLKEVRNADRYGVVDLDNGRVVAMREKGYTSHGYINGGVYCIKRSVFANDEPLERFSFEQFLMDNTGGLNIYGFPFDGSFIDIGIPEDYLKAQSLLPEWVKV